MRSYLAQVAMRNDGSFALQRFRVCNQMQPYFVEGGTNSGKSYCQPKTKICLAPQVVRPSFRPGAGAASIGIAKFHGFSLALSYHSRRAVHGMPFNASSVPVFGQ